MTADTLALAPGRWVNDHGTQRYVFDRQPAKSEPVQRTPEQAAAWRAIVQDLADRWRDEPAEAVATAGICVCGALLLADELQCMVCTSRAEREACRASWTHAVVGMELWP